MGSDMEVRNDSVNTEQGLVKIHFSSISYTWLFSFFARSGHFIIEVERAKTTESEKWQ